ncbi:TonB-dependent receptor plug [Pedobacter heparinus DSM 2366]|uniref:TonB-dependent receptor plug n=3 Tax=Pedobacter TaxID=84567 RepID=C6Y3R5_PEDHD|nr:TonB-dependent receptor plug [Pedobacter heparinus DSM 2366]
MRRFLILLVFSLACMSTYAQNVQLSGTVTDKDGVSLPGVSILVEGTKIGAVSNAKGQYSISLPNPNSVIVFSFLGYISQNVNAKGRSKIDVSLSEDSKSLDEVIMVGYGAQKKASVIGAISNINMKELRKAAPSNLSNALGGRVPGIISRMGDGTPGGVQNRFSNGNADDAQIYLRGRASMNNTSALVLIDGVEGSLSRINPEDIEQFSVLKDASATAVYGVRGANGVILITTRKGSIGAPKIGITSQIRMQKVLDFPNFLRSYDFAMLNNEARKNQGLPEIYSAEDLEHYRTGDDPYGWPDVDWKEVLLKDQFYEQQYVGNVYGGTERVSYYLSGEYNQSGGAFIENKEKNTQHRYRRYNLRTNLDFKITKTTDLGVKLNGRLNDLHYPLKGESSGQRVTGPGWSDITARAPLTAPVYNPNGTYANGGLNLPGNPVAEYMEGGFAQRLQSGLESNFTLNQKLDFVTPGLSFRGLFAANFGSGSAKALNSRSAEIWTYDKTTKTYTLTAGAGIPTYTLGSNFSDFNRIQQVEAALNYDKAIGMNHKITAMAIATQTTKEASFIVPTIFKGMAGRLTYAYKDKYLAEGNVGYNGSDAFSKSKRYAFFPSGALGWVASEESFIKDNVKFLDFLKFRGSYGEVGNDRLGFGYSNLYIYSFRNPLAAETPGTSTTVNGYYSLGTTPTQILPILEGTLGNPNVTWEVARKADIGVEAKLFKSRLSFEADVFLEKRDDILINRFDIPLISGLVPAKLPALNAGKATNKGYELSLSYSDNIGGFGFTVGGNYTFVRNTIDYMAETPKKYPWQEQTGKQIGMLAPQFIWTGKFYSEEDLTNNAVPKPVAKVWAGELMFKDLNGDGKIDSDDKAYTGYGQIPEKIFGINLNMDYKNFYLNTFWQGASNVVINPTAGMRLEYAGYGYNVQEFHKEDRWVYDPSRGLDTRATAKYPLLMLGGAPQTRELSTFHVLNGEYLRLKAAEFGYTFPKTLITKLHIADLRVFVSGSNLLTFSHLKRYHIDPEYLGNNIPGQMVAGQGEANGLGSGAWSPQNKFYAFGLNVTF